jgi:hypothetical protein
MNGSVDFDCQFRVMKIEINDKTPYDMLPTEMQT